jgi:hypothetical protein
MTGAARIRWQEEPVNGEAMGSVGILDQAVFRIWPPEDKGGEWMLTAARLPGYVGRRFHAAAAEELKAEAERWLEEFISSPGASLGAADARWRSLKDHLTVQVRKNLDIAEGFGAVPADASSAGVYYAQVSAHRNTLATMRELEAGHD